MKFLKVAAILAVGFGLASSAFAQTYDAKASFSSTNNPNGVWTYGWSATLSGSLTVFPNTAVVNGAPNWLDNSITQAGAPCLGYNPLGVSISNNIIPPLTMFEHPGPENQFTHCRFTAPTSGTYNIQASFTALDVGGPHGYILKNGTSIGDSLLAQGVAKSYSFTSVALAAGDTIEAVVGVGTDNTFSYDQTAFTLTVTAAPPPPGTVYDAKAGFSTTSNPSGVWTYGWSTALSGSLTVYTDYFLTASSENWGDASILQDGAPCVAYNNHSTTINSIPAYAMSIAPGPGNQFSHCRFTAPAAGEYNIQASFTSLSFGAPHGYILKNGTSIGGSALSENIQWSGTFNSVSLATGDTIDAAIGVGVDNTYYNDSTEFSLTITATNDAPVITSATTVATTQGLAYSYQIAAANNPTLYSAAGLPAGLTLNATTGLISGTIAALGSASATIGAANVSGTGYATLEFNILPAGTYDAKAEFSTSSNPAGVWSYGWSTTLSGSLTIYTDYFLTASSENWGDASIMEDNAPCVAYNNHDTTIDSNPPLAMNFGPGPENQFSHCRFTAPVAGVYNIQASFTSVSFGAPHGYILKNGISIGDSALSEGVPWSPALTPVILAAGDTIDVAIGVGADNTYYNDSTEFSLTITELNSPLITSAANAVAAQNKAFSYQIAATGNPTAYSASGLPAGLTLDATTGLISGTATELGNANVTIGAANVSGTGYATLGIDVFSETTVYDAKADFSATNNPNGVWAYGWSAALSGSMTVYPDAAVVNGAPNWLDDSIIQDGAPCLGYNPLNVSIANDIIPPHVMFEHPGPESQLAHCRFTAPTSGTYSIQASFTALDIGAPHGYLLENGTSIGDSLLSEGQAQGYSVPFVVLAAGDTVEAVVGVGANNVYYNDQTEFSLTVTLYTSAPSVPPPPGPPVAGVFTGLFQGSGVPAGILTARVAKNGSFTAVLNFEGHRVPLKGVFGNSGVFTSVVTWAGGMQLTVSLSFDGNGDLTGTAVENGHTYSLSAGDISNTGGAGGPYTFAISPDLSSTSQAGVPQGSGFGYMQVLPDGEVSILGELGDGTRFSTSTWVTSGSSVPIYANPYGAPGSGISGNLIFQDVPGVSDFSGILYWSRPATHSKTPYAQGFNAPVEITGARFDSAVGGLENDDVSFSASDGGLAAGVTANVTLQSNAGGLVSAGSIPALQLNISPQADAFSGKFLDPATHIWHPFSGILLPKSRTGLGLFFSGGLSGGVEIQY